jgi:hypothetical protein
MRAPSTIPMTIDELARKIEETATRIGARVRDVSPEDLHLILWNLLRPKKDPGDFLLKRVGEDRWAR